MGLRELLQVNNDGFVDIAATSPQKALYILFLGAAMELLSYQQLTFAGASIAQSSGL